ncbi:MAG: CPBP family intramembrane glutamic endopeptidase [Rickettsiales bacterium]
MQRILSKPFMLAELALFMLGVPLLLWLALPPFMILPVLWTMAVVTYHIARIVTPAPVRVLWNWSAVNWTNLKVMLLRFIICACLMAGVTYLFKPEMLFSFVRQKPYFWAVVMVIYPVLSVIPQEIIFRTYIFQRYKGLMTPLLLVLVSGIGFGFVHIVFNNWVAPALCTIGGLIFASTYQRTRSLALVSIEHALYGDFLFTVGLGRYFYHGAVGM